MSPLETDAEPSAAAGAARWLVEPFVMGTPEQFTRVRETLGRLGFTEREVCERAGVNAIDELSPSSDSSPPADGPSAAVRLFIDGAAFPWETVTAVFDQPALDSFRALGLLTSSAVDPGLCIAPVALYPIQGVYVASDRHGDMAHVAATVLPGDMVYSALNRQAREFVRLMPRLPCDDYLELCSGTGIAALIAAQTFAARACGVDITERSTRFARFNAALNGLENATMLQGDCFAPVAGRTFDVISAHPPYVPSLGTEMVYRDGGEDGEQVTRGILAGLAEHLRPGGLFYASCMITDRKGRAAEQRIRDMIGPTQNDFDVILVQLGEYDVEAQFTREVDAGKLSAEASRKLIQRFHALEVERFIVVAFLVHRRSGSSDGPPLTERQYASAATTGEHLQWFLRWCLLAAELEGDPDRVLDARPRSVERTELRSRSALKDGRWTAADATLVSHVPFEAQAPCPMWCATFLTWCDGRVTAREHLRRLREAEAIPDSVEDAAFASFVRKLAGGGFVELDVCPLPTSSSVSSGAA